MHFNDINFLERKEETWEIKVARKIRQNPQNRQKQKKKPKRLNKDTVNYPLIIMSRQ